MKLRVRTCISYQQILGSVGTEHSVALEDLDRLTSGIGDCNIDNVVFRIGNRNRERAGCRSSASQQSNWKSLGEHDDRLRGCCVGEGEWQWQ